MDDPGRVPVKLLYTLVIIPNTDSPSRRVIKTPNEIEEANLRFSVPW